MDLSDLIPFRFCRKVTKEEHEREVKESTKRVREEYFGRFLSKREDKIASFIMQLVNDFEDNLVSLAASRKIASWHINEMKKTELKSKIEARKEFCDTICAGMEDDCLECEWNKSIIKEEKKLNELQV